ncbi:uncharacterized protein BJ171DRAFT_423587, partial [Polychytrium aggregatum]|uniref:uncharacterized protein n=1 Tax=Polychytrium aggregatum TaxID=110093 RepID=UPI0022FEA331
MHTYLWTSAVLLAAVAPSVTAVNQLAVLQASTAAAGTAIPNFNLNQFPVSNSQFCRQIFQENRAVQASNGSQIKTGACSSTPMGQIPTFNNMVSTLITNPVAGATLNAAVDNTVTIDLLNMATGFFDDPQQQYYIFPQSLNNQGNIQGHNHITIQTLAVNAAPDPRAFVFFKGLNQASPDGRTLSVTVPAGTFKVNGVHRICSLAGTFSHQPVVMPVAQRGAQDDCIRIIV